MFQYKSNLNIFKGAVIIYQEMVAAFTSFITTVKRTWQIFSKFCFSSKFFEIGRLTLTLYQFDIMKPTNVSIF